MRQKKLSHALAVSIIMLIINMGISEAANNPALAIMDLYWDQTNNHDLLSPYAVSILALNELEEGRNIGMVKNFILWYLKSINDNDMNGLSGTIYDYKILPDRETAPTGDYDSADGYAGIFLYLLKTYYEKTGDQETLAANWRQIEHIVYVVAFLQDIDGLTRTTNKNQIKYLMDNIEAYAGVSAFISLSRAINKSDSNYYNDIRSGIRTGINEIMYDSKRRNFIWALNDKERFITDLKKFYPDAYSNIMLFAYDHSIFNGFLKRKSALWKDIMAEQSGHMADLPVEQRIIFKLAVKKMGWKE